MIVYHLMIATTDEGIDDEISSTMKAIIREHGPWAVYDRNVARREGLRLYHLECRDEDQAKSVVKEFSGPHCIAYLFTESRS